MIYHDKCGCIIRLKTQIAIVTMPIITRNGMKNGIADLNFDINNQKNKEILPFCVECGEDVDLDNLVGICHMHGGKYISIKELFISQNPNVPFVVSCKNCITEYALEADRMISIYNLIK